MNLPNSVRKSKKLWWLTQREEHWLFIQRTRVPGPISGILQLHITLVLEIEYLLPASLGSSIYTSYAYTHTHK